MNERKSEKDWEEYNCTMAKGTNVGIKKSTGAKPSAATSYTHVFLQQHGVEKHLNVDCNKVLQLGTADGRFIAELKEKGWNVKGYDYSKTAVEQLKKRGIPAFQVDLNALDQTTNKLLYHDQLLHDMSEPVNILLVRILQYLDVPALNLLLYTLIDHAPPGSIFFIAGNSDEVDKKAEEFTSRSRRYKACFFATRTDFEFLTFTQVNCDDELLVIRKLKSAANQPNYTAAEEKTMLDNKILTDKLRDEMRSLALPGELKLNFISLLSQNLQQADLCCRLAAKLIMLQNENDARVAAEYFSAYRNGAARKDFLHANFDIIFKTLSHGNLNHAKILIGQIIDELAPTRSKELFASTMPEVDNLKIIHARLMKSTLIDLQPTLTNEKVVAFKK